MRRILQKSIALVGMMGSGKTAVGTALADMLDVPFKDSDAAIVEAASMTIAEIFERDGEAFFRARETEVLARLMDDTPCILSTGGGAFMSEKNRKIIDNSGLSVFLDADLELLWSRVKHKTTRPLLRTVDPKATLTEIFETRAPIYAKAQIAVRARAGYQIGEMATAVIDALADVPELWTMESQQ